jgi:pyruvate kinase
VAAISTVGEISAFACETARKEGFASKGDIVVVAAGTPVGVSATTNMSKILEVWPAKRRKQP